LDRPLAAAEEGTAMPLLLIVLIAILIAQIGFWDTFGALLGAAAMLVLFVVVAIVAAGVAGYIFVRRTRRRF
jgi:hypothetical protein